MSKDINVYLAGPMTGLPDYNFREFATTALVLRKASGCHVVHTANLPRGWSWDKYISLSCSVLADCDAVVVLPGSEHSKGVELELAEAEGRGLPVFYLPDELNDFLFWAWDKRGEVVEV